MSASKYRLLQRSPYQATMKNCLCIESICGCSWSETHESKVKAILPPPLCIQQRNRNAGTRHLPPLGKGGNRFTQTNWFTGILGKPPTQEGRLFLNQVLILSQRWVFIDGFPGALALPLWKHLNFLLFFLVTSKENIRECVLFSRLSISFYLLSVEG